MSLKVFSGFEENNLTAVFWDIVAGSVSISTAQKHSGTYSLHLNPTSAVANIRKTYSADPADGDSVFTTFYVYVVTRPGSANMFFFRSSENSAIQMDVDGTWDLFNDVTNTRIEGTTVLSLNTWYRIEIDTFMSDTVGTMEGRLYLGDATTPLETLNISAEDTLGTGTIRTIIGNTAADTYDFYIDDVAVVFSTGAAPTTQLGPLKIALTDPTGEVSTGWTKAGSSQAATNWEGVDEVPGAAPNDGVDYNQATTNVTDRLSLPALPAEVPSDADLSYIMALGRQGSNGTTGTRKLKYKLWDEGGTASDGPDVDCKLNGWRNPNDDEVLVVDITAKTKANLGDFDIGYERNHGGGNQERITTIFGNVGWLEAAAGGGVDRAGGAYHTLRPIETYPGSSIVRI